jgi:vacuolar-type H+-ATPase subunit I/STV1
MSIFTLDKQLDQIRTEFTQRMDLLEQKLIKEVQRLGEAQRSPVPPEVSQVLKELGLLQEQVLAQLPERLEQVQKQVQEGFLSLPEQLELLQGQAGDLSASIASTPTKLEQLQTRIDELLSQFAQESPLLPILQELQRQIAEMAQPSSAPNTLEQLQEQVDEISSQVTSASGVFDVLRQVKERLGTELIPAIPSGEQKPDDLIHACIQKTIGAINTLEQDLTAWLKQHDLIRSKSREAFAEKLIQDFASSVRVHIASEQEGIPVSTEALPPGEQDIPLIDQSSETDTVNDITEESNFPQLNEDEE